MSNVLVWFERKFSYSPPKELLPNLIARLRGTPARLEEALRGRAHDALVATPGGKWSAQETAGHLLQLEPLWLSRVEDYVKGSEWLTPTDLQNRKTDEAAFNKQELEEILSGFREARQKLVLRVEELSDEAFERTIPHPRLKTPMAIMDHLYFVAEHDDHHLAQIWELTRTSR